MSTDKSITYGVGWQCPHCKAENLVTVNGHPIEAETVPEAERVAKYLKGPGMFTARGWLRPPLARNLVPADYTCAACQAAFRRGAIAFHAVQK